MKRLFSFFVTAVTVLATFAPSIPVARAAEPDGNAYFDKVFYYNGSTYSDVTTAASNVNGSDVPLGSIGNTNGIVYFGMNSPVDKISFEFGQWGGGTGGLTWEYSKGGACIPGQCWAAATEESNPSSDFTSPSGDGMTEIELAAPSSFGKRSVNGVEAYWIRARTTADYGFTQPKASRVKARAYNLKTHVSFDSSGLDWTSDFTPTLITSGCTTSYGYWNAGGGEHYYALRTDGGACSLGAAYSGYTEIFGNTVFGMNTTLKDAGNIVMKETLKVTVSNFDGDSVTNAIITYDGEIASKYQSGGTYYLRFIPQNNKVLSVGAPGYVTESNTADTQNTAFGDVSLPESGQVHIALTGTLPPCEGSISSGGTTVCQGLRPDLTVKVVDAADQSLLGGATVSVYTDSGMTTLADDLSNSASSNDAQMVTPSESKVGGTLALASGTYYYKVTLSGYADASGSFTVTSGIYNEKTVQLSTESGGGGDTTVSASQSTIGVSPSSIVADGVKTATVTVIAKNAAGEVLSGKTVTVGTSLANVNISPSQATTNSSGVATFTAKSSVQGTTTLSALIDGVSINSTASLTLTEPVTAQCSNPVVSIGSLVKLPDDGDAATQIDSAVYYYGADCKRHAFPNSKVYFSWYTDFSGVEVVQPSVLASMTLGPNVTYRPGVKMVKFTTDNKVYAVSKGGNLRWVTTEGVAVGLYGSNWNTKIDDISDAFYTNYTFGSAINTTADYNVTAEMANATTIDDSL